MLYGEPRNATTITCIDCHGTIDAAPTLITSGNAGQIDLLQQEQHAVGAALHLGRQQAFSAIDHVAGCALGNSANDRHDRSALVALQSEVGLRENAAARWKNLGRLFRPATAEANAASRRLAHDNSAMDCQICHTSWATSCFGCHLPMKANQRVPLEQIRRRHRPQFHHLQSAGRARRRFHARHRRHGEEKSHGGDPFLERGGGQLAKCESRMGLFAAANVFGRRLQRPGVQPAFPAHHQRRRHDEELHRLPSLEERTTTTRG